MLIIIVRRRGLFKSSQILVLRPFLNDVLNASDLLKRIENRYDYDYYGYQADEAAFSVSVFVLLLIVLLLLFWPMLYLCIIIKKRMVSFTLGHQRLEAT